MNNTPTNSQPEQTVDTILARLAWSGKYTDAGQEVVSAGEVAEAQAALNRQALATALRLIGDDLFHIDNSFGVDRKIITTGQEWQNELKSELRQAFTDYYGGTE